PATWRIYYSRIALARDLRGPQCRIALSLLSDLGDVSIVEVSTPDDEAKSAVLSELSARGIEIVADDGPLCMMLPKLLSVVCSSRASIGGEKDSTMLLCFRRVRYALGAPVDLSLHLTLGMWTAGCPTGAIGGLAVIIISFAWLMAFSLGSCVALVAIADSSGFPLSLMSLTVYSIGLNLGNLWTSTTTLRLHKSRHNVVDVLNYGARSIYLALALPLAFVAGIAVAAAQRETLVWLMLALVTLAILARLEGMTLTPCWICLPMSSTSNGEQKGPIFGEAKKGGGDEDGAAKSSVVYIQPVEDGLSLPKLLFMEKEWSWSSLIVNIIRTLGASLERDFEIDAVFPGQYMIDAFKRNLSLKNEQDASILCEELAKLDLIMVRTDGVHENERFDPEYDYSLVYHLKPHVLNSVRFVRSGTPFEVGGVDEAVAQMQDVIVKLTKRMNRLKGFYSKLDDSEVLVTDWLLLAEDPEYLRFQELTCMLQVICGSSEGSADSILFKVAQERP
ncbi:hypothetical protein FOZ62_031644, partial [Perkinsus olseni]